MSLPDSYLQYPHRRHGQDIARYAWALAKDRAPVRLPGVDVIVSLIVPCEWFPLNPSGKPFKHPGAMQTPYPDLRHFTTRDYGNRVGVFRLLEALAGAGVAATFPLSAALLDRAPPLVKALTGAGHEVAAAGLHTDAIHWGGLSPEEEFARVVQVRAAFADHGLQPRAWMSPARQQGFATLDALAAHGFSVCLDWEADQVPLALATSRGPVICLPVFNELEDWRLIIERRQSEGLWADQVLEAVAFLRAEAATRGTGALGVTLTPYVLGQPFRIHAVRGLLAALTTTPGVALMTASAAVDAFLGAAP